MNKWIGIGRFTRDNDLRNGSNMAVLRNTLAIDRQHKKGGEKQTDYINVIAFGKTAEVISKYTTKGSKVSIVGRIVTGSYKNNDGKMIYTTDVAIDELEFLDQRRNDSQELPKDISPASQSSDGFMNIPSGLTDELPFN